jgi:transposase-like protein
MFVAKSNRKEGKMTTWNLTLTDSDNQTALVDAECYLKEMVEMSLQQILEAEMSEYLGAEPYERTDGRIGLRNGYKDRTLNLRIGSVYLKVPQARDGSFHTALFARYQRSERAFTLAIVEMWVKGVSTRKIADITDKLCSVTFSKSTVSELCKSLDTEILAWKARDLSFHTYPYLYVDALYEDVRKGGSVVSEGVLVVCGVRDDGRREILDVAITDTESAATYNELFSSLRERGVSGVMLVTSDAHAGLKVAIKRYFQGASWQRCQVHFIRDATGKVSLKRRKELGEDIGSIFEKRKKGAAMKRASEIAGKWRSIAPRVSAMIDEDIEQCLSVLSFPEDHQKSLRTNNLMERLNEEIRRRDRVIGIFPNEAAALRLICALCIEKSETWTTESGVYLDMSLLYVEDEPVTALIEYLKFKEERKAG